ncbi:NADH:ubiquinone reductase (Na(+)-transporting) subunit B [Sunxiuqinia elliptica]|uniref:Na(+)-translocating NADH-quinone reductase subunit B n=1 Tax=Sunxiuqinia elliptica TaxID=655355 RepID=A0A4R6H558_9BACT|nr:NADH:ubiquinone reductase (Na(+)-transporting) subunit B [Sunxiuqinia elliptica]TDO03302.1 Na+-transporting NADH:ubiquinone oxidoreductase subunit B [Sunxiuqinia elliptica]TDO59499.1 Na+-transporting NADH:ubiquinone oxidoreductase subunit B [Sunxiuqinia elliptica]
MKALRNFFEKTKPHVQKGAKYHWLHSTHDAFFTLAFVQKDTSKSGTHVHDYIDLKRTMGMVVLALVPALLMGMYNIGYQHFGALGQLDTAGFFDLFLFGLLKVLPVIIVSYVVGLGVEFLFAQLRGHEVNEGFLVSGILIPMVMPINTPLWMIGVATAFAVIFGKEVFGGTGMNIWNPALIARAFLFFAYPAQMSGDSVWISASGIESMADGFTGATPMAQAVLGETNLDAWHAFIGLIPGSIGETSTLAILIGAAILIITGIGNWKIMLSTVLGGVFMGILLNIFAVNAYMEMPFWEHLIIGGFAFGAVFMATDPVSAAQTEKGKWIYGFLIGVLAILIRVVNPAYPEGMMLAILLMNTFAPLIDHYIIQGNIKRRLKRVQQSA